VVDVGLVVLRYVSYYSTMALRKETGMDCDESVALREEKTQIDVWPVRFRVHIE
jgi:hypothetical protein